MRHQETVTVFGEEQPLGDATTFALEMAGMVRTLGVMILVVLPPSMTMGIYQAAGWLPWLAVLVPCWAFLFYVGRVLWRLQDIVLDDHRRRLILEEGKRREAEAVIQAERDANVAELLELRDELD